MPLLVQAFLHSVYTVGSLELKILECNPSNEGEASAPNCHPHFSRRYCFIAIIELRLNVLGTNLHKLHTRTK